jgi:hypothetical protein
MGPYTCTWAQVGAAKTPTNTASRIEIVLVMFYLQIQVQAVATRSKDGQQSLPPTGGGVGITS